jgi:hypothetical protein
MLRLGSLRPDCVIVPVPNGVYIPARSQTERALAARLISQMKAEGQLLPGAPDLLVLWDTGSGAIELKRPAEHTLIGKRAAGRPSDAQKEFAALCAEKNVRHTYATSWVEVQAALSNWGRLT